ncbi:MAG TPA: cold shock domain-containing protein [Roseateles sp.]|nr:cold shock domain-containing protein [Roseateles sp.]
MPFTGTLRTWHDERGFGFIAPAHGGPELFVHISAFPSDGTRPTEGETLSYELGRGDGGKPQAVRVVRKAIGTRRPPAQQQAASLAGSRTSRPASGPPSSPSSRAAPLRQPRRDAPNWLARLLTLLIFVGLGAFGYKQYQSYERRLTLERMPAEPSVPVEGTRSAPRPALMSPGGSNYRCDGRQHCSQMGSCAEATWFINNCPGTQMDGDRDGIPCEQQLCTGPLGGG